MLDVYKRQVVDYTFTNNSDEATSFMVATIDKAFQNGVELDTGMVMNINNEAAMKDIKPGASVQVQQAFKLADQSEVTVEVEELLSMKMFIRDSLCARCGSGGSVADYPGRYPQRASGSSPKPCRLYF